MAIGDVTPSELCLAALGITAATVITNAGASYRTQATQIFIANTGASQRTITLYKNGIATTNIIASSIVIPAGGSVIIDTKLILTGTQTIGAKQDVGTDCNIAIYGIVEQIA
ncbi:hypothetical protein [Acetobacterium wieringae]|uniref:Uncharacterized protein n=1 Tax=Acetobacterium wieringae TaxID=52694 RepID=A0A1F2PD00_9FIRM|nr:hypothetical protein [Acetobacterium wieringae]OFV69247.1 hypothetical protein ACWI_32910 [Acetobacterium wieringae]